MKLKFNIIWEFLNLVLNFYELIKMILKINLLILRKIIFCC